MNLKIQNTLTRKKEEFIPIDPKLIRVYSCGPTVYSTPHIGNLRAAIFADILRNTLKNILGYNTTHVMNITDVGHLTSDADSGEDKMEKWAKKEWLTARDVAKKYEKIFMESLAWLNIEPFDVMPKATDHIQEQIELVQKIEKNGYTYKIDWDWIYMDTSKIDDYGKLMWKNYKKHLDGLNAGARISCSQKRNITDFALRKFSPEWQQRDMERDSPRWKWFPGRHIECSAMSSKYLGEQFDIHTGWVEHISIHHTDEIAQTECAFWHKPRVKYRMHNQHLQVDGWKMSKSLWNVYNLSQLEEKWFSPLDLRYFFFTAHYGSFQNFTWELLESARKWRLHLRKKLWHLSSKSPKNISELKIFLSEEWNDFLGKIITPLLDDLNTASMLAEINKLSHNLNDEKLEIIYFLEKNILKLWLFEPISTTKFIEIPQQIKKLAESRLQAKQNKNYELADELRIQIQDFWFDIKDEKNWYSLSKL